MAHYCKSLSGKKKKDDQYPLVENLPKIFLVANRILPLRVHNGAIDVAIADPSDLLLRRPFP